MEKFSRKEDVDYFRCGHPGCTTESKLMEVVQECEQKHVQLTCTHPADKITYNYSLDGRRKTILLEGECSICKLKESRFFHTDRRTDQEALFSLCTALRGDTSAFKGEVATVNLNIFEEEDEVA